MRGGGDMGAKLARTLRVKQRAAEAVAWCREQWPGDDPLDHLEEAKRKFGYASDAPRKRRQKARKGDPR
jgi:hypothetical protein